MVYRYDVHNVACPYCGAIMSGKVQRTAQKYSFYGAKIRDGKEPWFGLELCSRTNRRQVSWLADLRARPPSRSF